MKKIVFFLSFISVFLFSAPIFSAVTTSDGIISLNYYEDTQSGIQDRWIFEIFINDVGNNIETIEFNITIKNIWMNFWNEYNNPLNGYATDDYIITVIFDSLIPGGITQTPDIYSLHPIQKNTELFMYAVPHDMVLQIPYQGELIIGNFDVDLSYSDNLGQNYEDTLTLTGPIGFAPVPEPFSMGLFALGLFLIRFLIKK